MGYDGPMTNTAHTTTTRTGIEAIDCPDCGAPHIVDYDTHAISIAHESDPRSEFLDDDGRSFDCLDCGAKVSA